ncbi:LIVCS family branched-chain amino acid:cation transporter [Arcanobacterium wilhelmae]|uniref:LIVCS family branched-chain amino acid:cation transporter n=1 Tax=Arcanobacterium wilhelmae TaxID=1803177 RepID=A0ABT9N9S5_9ACTO|nr:branched-chain amino acid transport system II carrier protein [Arcanobacterium wilhelmae]MDP9800459.1 LIVCS family branched-chain amino acid:cation transporter [Arcanobacterium wilhelmae]WFN89879.1 branched-chain amino acid transport system II carrier protein [Arcanobacterium wilhelmae]
MRTLLVSGLALFAMFFGAGNLILPTMIGVNAGEAAWVAAFGFLITGVALPALSMIAYSTKRAGEPHIGGRIGRHLGPLLVLLVFLSCGMLYGIPRVAAVSFEMSVAPVLGEGANVVLAQALFLAVFFAIAFLAVLRPNQLVNRIGLGLTPVLMLLLVALIIGAFQVAPAGHPVTADFQAAPVATGVIQGYFTMDAIAAIVFGGVIYSAMEADGRHGASLRRGMAGAAAVAAGMLALVYLGLVRVGMVGAGDNGAAVLSNVAKQLFGSNGQLVFGLIVSLACLTTVLGLLGASTQYFHRIFPQVSTRVWLVVHVLVAFALANLGLTKILAVVAPLNQLLYPVAICLVLVALLEMGLGRKLTWAYYLPAWVSAVLAVLEALNSTGLAVFAPLRTFLNFFPLGAYQVAWLVPALVALVVGLVLDFRSNPEVLADEPVRLNDDLTTPVSA